MAMIRLPVCGDWIEGDLIVGLSALSCAESEISDRGTVTVWCLYKLPDGSSSVRKLTQIQVKDLEAACYVRDQIAELAQVQLSVLPVSGDRIDPALVAAITTEMVPSGGLAMAVVWIADPSDTGPGLSFFTAVGNPTLAQAVAVRDAIAEQVGLGRAYFDQEEADLLRFEPDDDDGADGGAGGLGGGRGGPVHGGGSYSRDKRNALGASELEMRDMLQWWDPQTRSH